jgi:hypothetical protein
MPIVPPANPSAGATPQQEADTEPLYPSVEDVFPDAHYFNPARMYQASMTYLWWVSMMLSGRASGCGSFASHLSYYRREHARERHGAGYQDSWGFVLKSELSRLSYIRSPHQRRKNPVQ